MLFFIIHIINIMKVKNNEENFNEFGTMPIQQMSMTGSIIKGKKPAMPIQQISTTGSIIKGKKPAVEGNAQVNGSVDHSPMIPAT